MSLALVNPALNRVKVIHIRSSDCVYLNGTNDNIVFNLTDNVICDPNEVILVQVLNASIPYSFYNVNYSNQFLDVQEEINGITKNYSVEFEVGNYNIQQYTSLLQTYLNEQSNLNGHGFNYLVSYNKFNNKVSFSLTTANATTKFLFSSGPNHLYSNEFILGFDNKDYQFNSLASLTSPNVVNMSPYENVLIHSNLGITNQYETLSKNLSNILLKIPINSSPFSYIQYQDISQNQKYVSSLTTITALNFWLTDSDNYRINLNNIPWYLTIKFEFIKKENHFTIERDATIPVEIANTEP
jgi:hypothetical protein